ncbi:MAG: LPS export ABC transporter permease LptF [Gammaproteobacteria bacterium]|nr:LPS export ABC transporter permease LptF [Gammaproteobacteria bacterium]
MRIIYRYLRKEIFYNMIAITSIMVFIFVCNRLIHFLHYFSQGKYGAGFLIHLVLLQVPVLFGLFLSLGLFLGILLSYGRLYVDSEMVILFACGVSRRTLLTMTMKIATIVSIFVGVLVFFVNPYINLRQDKLFRIIETKTVFQTILPAQFQASPQDQEVFYVKNMSPDRSKLDNLFIAQRIPQQNATPPFWAVLSAKSGYQKIDEKTDDHFMVAVDGHRYEGSPGQKNFEITKFHEYGLRLPSPDLSKYTIKAKSLPTLDLLKSAWADKSDMAELQWRISMPLTAFILTLLAVPLSRVKPRQGRFGKLWYAILIYIIYANMLIVSRDWVSNGVISPWIGMWWIHFVLLIPSLWLLKRFEHEIN